MYRTGPWPPSEHSMATDGVCTSSSTGGFASSRITSGSQTAQTLSSHGNVMWQPPGIPGTGWRGNSLGEDLSEADSHLSYVSTHAEGRTDTERGSFMSGVLSEGGLLLSFSDSKGVPTPNSGTAREGPKRRDRSFRACDNCRTARVRCSRDEPGGTCQRPSPATNPSKGPDTVATLPMLRDVRSDLQVFQTAEMEEGKKCRRCSRRRISCGSKPCAPCARASVECVIPTRAPRGLGRRKRPSRAHPKGPAALAAQNTPGFLDPPHSFSFIQGHAFSDNASPDTQASVFQQPASFYQPMVLKGYGTGQQCTDLQSLQPSQTHATGIYDFPVIGPEVTGFENYSFDEESPFAQYSPSHPPQRHQLDQPQMFQQQSYRQQQQVHMLSRDVGGEAPIQDDPYDYAPIL